MSLSENPRDRREAVLDPGHDFVGVIAFAMRELGKLPRLQDEKAIRSAIGSAIEACEHHGARIAPDFIEGGVAFCLVNARVLGPAFAYRSARGFARLRLSPGLTAEEKRLFRDELLRVRLSLSTDDDAEVKVSEALQIIRDLIDR